MLQVAMKQDFFSEYITSPQKEDILKSIFDLFNEIKMSNVEFSKEERDNMNVLLLTEQDSDNREDDR